MGVKIFGSGHRLNSGEVPIHVPGLMRLLAFSYCSIGRGLA